MQETLKKADEEQVYNKFERKLIAEFKDNKIVLKKMRARQTENDIEVIELKEIQYNKKYKSKIYITNSDDKNKIFLLEKLEHQYDEKKEAKQIEPENEKENKDEELENEVESIQDAVLVYSDSQNIYYIYGDIEEVYKALIKVKHKVLSVKLNRSKVSITILACIINKYNLRISDKNIHLTDTLYKRAKLKEYEKNLGKLRFLLKNKTIKYKFNMKDIINDESKINNGIHFSIKVDDTTINYNIGIREKNITTRMYYVPLRTMYYKDYAMNIRRTSRGNMVFIKRLKEDIEKTLKFKFFESPLISGILYRTGEIKQRFSKKKINLLYEKFSSKAEEGVYELCKKMQESKESKNYFIIDPESEDYERIKESKFVVPKYSYKYYKLLYRANNVITTEAPMHINILRSNNKHLRKSIYNKKFIFLQHGIIFMKNLGQNSSFIKNREAEPDYIIVSSEKEKDVVADMLELNEERILKTGIAIFSQIEFKHINNKSDDYVTVMLTWKPYEEHLYNFEESSYYKYTMEIYKTLTKYIPKEKIFIIPHPKVYDLLNSTKLAENIWKDKISNALEKTKVLITDYSSICYNAFYQGAGVIFYQNDLEKYQNENGELIPYNDEYVGERIFTIKELKNLLNESISNKRIDLSKIRNEKHEEAYKSINEFNDGKNIDRIFEELIKLKLI